MNDSPLVSIGLPVYNGERYLEEAVRSILSQSYSRIEVIISDNASTDGTREICEAVAASDERVQYIRQPKNLGAAPNYDFVAAQARGPYFKWMAHDDVYRPEFIEACVAALEADPEAVLAYTSIQDIDSEGAPMGRCDVDLGFGHPNAAERFRRTMRRPHKCVPIFGVMRLEVLRRTGGHGSYPSSDRNLLGELALHGKLTEVPEVLMLHREHDERFSIKHRTVEAKMGWLDTSSASRVGFPIWRRLGEYLRAIRSAPLTPEDRAAAYWWMVRWSRASAGGLAREAFAPLSKAYGPLWRRVRL